VTGWVLLMYWKLTSWQIQAVPALIVWWWPMTIDTPTRPRLLKLKENTRAPPPPWRSTPFSRGEGEAEVSRDESLRPCVLICHLSGTRCGLGGDGAVRLSKLSVSTYRDGHICFMGPRQLDTAPVNRNSSLEHSASWLRLVVTLQRPKWFKSRNRLFYFLELEIKKLKVKGMCSPTFYLNLGRDKNWGPNSFCQWALVLSLSSKLFGLLHIHSVWWITLLFNTTN
jgi:hypothetical protein